MTKVKLAEATKELNAQSGVMLEETTRVRRNIEGVLQALRKQESLFLRQEEEQRAKKKLEEQQALTQQHAKAWTMPDDDAAQAQPVQTQPMASAPQEAAAAQPQEKPAAKEEKIQVKQEPVAEPAAEPERETRREEPAAQAQPAPEKQQDAPQVEKAAPEVKAEPKTQAEDQQPAKAAEKPAQQAQAKAEEKPVAPAAQPAAAKPQEKQPEVKPAPQPMQAAPQPRPQPVAGQGQPFQRPQGPYGRPANPQGQQGPYGRPANPQGPYGRPANPQGQQGPYGRPANPQGQQGPYGRPVNPQGQQGPYGRPANPQGPYGRPANPQGQQGPYGRPANPQGPYGRPAGAPGGFQQRPPMGGAPRPGMASRSGGAAGGRPRASGGIELTPVIEKERVSNYDPNKKQYIRQHDPEHVAKNRKQLVKEAFNGYDDDMVRGGKRSRVKKPSAQQMMAPIKIEKAYMSAENITVKDLTERIGKPAGEILKKLLMLGIMANINSELDYDTASLVCSEFGVELEVKMDKTAEDALSDANFEDKEEDLQPRPPVITIMGHVDHGKTTLLDYIRKSKVAAGEAGGITQHIGAYTVKLKGRVITFLDTPGHEAFTAMRLRGAQATDIAVLVVAADDGVMPQTIEAIHHAKAAGVPIVVAINKMDKPGANPDRIMQDLTKYELVPEAWGGDTIMAPVSAVTGQGVDELLEMILLQADVLQLRANPDRMATGVIIEAKLDKARGPLATVLLKNGTLHVGDNIVAGMASGRVRALTNDRGERVQSAGPSMPVEIAGFEEVPLAGEEMNAVEDDKLSRQVAQERRDKVKAARASSVKVSLDNLFANISEGKVQNLNIIIKADVQGSVEAVKQSLEKLSDTDVKVHVLHSAVGAITQDDVNLASAFNAIIIGFNIRPDASARDAAEKEGVDIRLYRIIYQAIEDIQKAMKGLLAPQFKEVLLGHAEVRSVFKITGAGTVAGCYVLDGKMQRNASVRLLRDNVVIFEGKLSSLRRFKDDVREVAAGYECGIGLENYNDIKESDTVECFEQQEIER